MGTVVNGKAPETLGKSINFFMYFYTAVLVLVNVSLLGFLKNDLTT